MFIVHIGRLIAFPFRALYMLYGARRLRKWMKKNEKMQDPNYHDYEKRWEYVYKKMKGFSTTLGVKIVVEGKDNIPKSSFMLVANHSTNFDAFYIIPALGLEHPSTAIAKHTLKDSVVRGYFQATEAFYVYQNNARKSLQNFNRAGEWAKKNGRGVTIFPEGKRVWNAQIEEFRSASFKLSHRNYLAIIPTSIVGTVEARKWFSLKTRTVTVKFHPPIKSSEALKLSTTKLAEKAHDIIKKDLDDYLKTFDEKHLEKHQKEVERLTEKQAQVEVKREEKRKEKAAKTAQKK